MTEDLTQQGQYMIDPLIETRVVWVRNLRVKTLIIKHLSSNNEISNQSK